MRMTNADIDPAGDNLLRPHHHSDGIVSQFTTTSRKAAGVRVIPPLANGRSFSIKRTTQEAIAVENMNRAVAIAAGLPIWIIAVVVMIRIARINMTTH